MFLNFLLDSASPWQTFFQDPATPVMEGIINLHHDLMFFITFIFFFVFIVLGRTIFFYSDLCADNANSRRVVHGTIIEVV
jgi:cytochrome c oxidase subunit 2